VAEGQVEGEGVLARCRPGGRGRGSESGRTATHRGNFYRVITSRMKVEFCQEAEGRNGEICPGKQGDAGPWPRVDGKRAWAAP